MSPPTLGRVLRHLRRLAAPEPAGETGDAALLDRFVRQRDEDAFTTLVRRHGAMVLGVCRRILNDAHDAEDAFQAAFLVLAHQAASIRKQASLASWLYGVACRVARRARTAAARRRAVEKQGRTMPVRDPLTEAARRELRPLLDRELGRLPENMRAPLVLCYLEGKSQDEAARLLGVSPGAVKGRLERGRDLLRARLTRRGITLSVSGLATFLVEEAAAADVPVAMVAAAGRAAAVSVRAVALAEGVLRMMLSGKVKRTVGLTLLLGLLVLGAGLTAPSVLPREAQDSSRPQAGPVVKKVAPARDRFGDPLPPGAIARLGTVRLRHGAEVLSVSFSPDSKVLASAGWPGQADASALRLWDAATGKERFLLAEPESDTYLVAFAPRGPLLAAVRREAVLLVDLSTGKVVRSLPTPGEAWTKALAFSPDGKRLLTAGPDKLLRLWDVAAGKELRRFRGHTGEISSVAFSADGKTVASGGAFGDQTARLWDAATGDERRQLKSPNRGGMVATVAFTPDGKQVLVAGDGDPTLFDAATGREIRQYKGHRAAVAAAAFSPDGKYLASAGGDQATRVFDAASGKQLHVLPWAQGYATCLAISPDSATLAVGGYGNTVRLWDLKTGREKDVNRGHRGGVSFLAFSPDGGSVLTSGWDGTVRVWDPATSRERRCFGERSGEVAFWARQGAIAGIALTPDGKDAVLGSWADKMTLLDLATGQARRPFGDKQGAAHPAAVSPDGKHLVTMRQSGAVTLWDMAAGKELRELKGHEGQVTMAMFSPDGKTVATASRDIIFISGLANGPRGIKDSTIRFWDVATAKERLKVEAAVTAMAYSPDGRTLATGTGPGEVQWRDAATGKVFREHKVFPSWVNFLAFSPDGRCLAAAGMRDGTVYVWENASGLERCRFAGHRGDVNRVAFAPDGRTLASGGTDTSVLLWDVTGLRRAVRPRLPRTAEALWDDLGSSDGHKSHEAVWGLVAAPEQAVPLLQKHLRPARPVAPERVRQWIDDLDGERFAVRSRATAELEALRELAEPALRAAAKEKRGLEFRQRVEQLLKRIAADRLAPGAGRLRELRGIEVLEHLGTPEARRLLGRLAGGAKQARLTAEARAAENRGQAAVPNR